MSLPNITTEGQTVSALQDIAVALEHIARAIDTYNNYRFGPTVNVIADDPKQSEVEDNG